MQPISINKKGCYTNENVNSSVIPIQLKLTKSLMLIEKLIAFNYILDVWHEKWMSTIIFSRINQNEIILYVSICFKSQIIG